MAGMKVNPFALLAAQATKGIQGAGAAKHIAGTERADRFAAYKQADVKGNPFAPKINVGDHVVTQGFGQKLESNPTFVALG